MVDAYGELDVPKNKVTVLVVDNCGDTTVGIELRVFRTFLLLFLEVKVDRLVGQAKLLQDDSNFPMCRDWLI